MLDRVYRSKPRFLQHLLTQAANIDQFRTELGLSAAQIQELKDDAQAMNWFEETTTLVVTFKEAVVGAYNRFFSTTTEPAIGAFVAAPPVAPPNPPVAGAVKRARERDQLMLANKPSQNALEAMDLLGGESDDVPAGNVQPRIETHAAVTGYEFALVVSNRQRADLYDVFVQRSDSDAWEFVKSGTGKSVSVHVTPTVAGKAEQILVRVQLKRNDENYGVPSDPTYVTINP
jgi:hypothetical protein